MLCILILLHVLLQQTDLAQYMSQHPGGLRSHNVRVRETSCDQFVSIVRLDFGFKRLLVLLDLHVPAAESSQLHPQPEDPPQRPKTAEPAHQLPGRTQDGRLW